MTFFLKVLWVMLGAIIYWGFGFALVASGIEYFFLENESTVAIMAAIIGAVCGVARTIYVVFDGIHRSLARTMATKNENP
jgi:uncharacterized membrane protein YqgA involved in biofilm formation